jgi:hypothetical protein
MHPEPCTHSRKQERPGRGVHFLFSTLAIDIILAHVRRLIQIFLRTCAPYPAPDVEYTWREEARFETYCPFTTAPIVYHHQCSLPLCLPHSPLFSPLLFGLGPAALPFRHSYLQCFRVTNAMEHVSLLLICWQDAPNNESSDSFGGGPSGAASLGVPPRLKDWIRGYPAMLPEPSACSRKQEKLQPRRGACTVRVISVRRNVHMYCIHPISSRVLWVCLRAFERGDICPKCICATS